ncbi:uncharacterized protein LOC113272681 [Papaver somniferum]|uniref:uncharacterized protein LOC113272681 n=1 Tax=Papaver somniferum TaxID=3469 RepID=UPI000E702E1C|nr:uncharacterized protein LOC113272681 [Papaver somniferum]
MKNAVQLNMISVFSINSIQISHLQFIVFLDGTEEEAENLFILLRIFEAITGLSVNYSKGTIISIGANHKVQSTAEILKCRVESLPLKKYLGMSIGANSRCSAIWDSVIEKFQKKLAPWRRKFFTKAGRTGDQTLKDRFPNIFKLATKRDASLQEMVTNGTWNLHLKRNLTQQENPEILQLFAVLGSPPALNDATEDDLICNAPGGFKAQLCYNWLIEKLPESLNAVPYSCTWVQFVPPKIQYFMWTAAQNAIPTVDNLLRRGCQIQTATCDLCNSLPE